MSQIRSVAALAKKLGCHRQQVYRYIESDRWRWSKRAPWPESAAIEIYEEFRVTKSKPSETEALRNQRAKLEVAKLLEDTKNAAAKRKRNELELERAQGGLVAKETADQALIGLAQTFVAALDGAIPGMANAVASKERPAHECERIIRTRLHDVRRQLGQLRTIALATGEDVAGANIGDLTSPAIEPTPPPSPAVKRKKRPDRPGRPKSTRKR